MSRTPAPKLKDDAQLMKAALHALREFGCTNISSAIYDNAVKAGVSIEGFVRNKERETHKRCPRKAKHGNGKKALRGIGNGQNKVKRHKQNTSVMISESSIALDGCTADVSELRAQLNFLELKVASMLLSRSLGQSQEI